MWQNFINFIKYNNATVLIIVVIFIIGGSVFASEPGRAAIGQKETRVEGIDNTILLAVDLANFNMDFKITKIEQDDQYYYVTYTFLDLAIIDSAWQYQLKERVRKVSRDLKEDLGSFLAAEFKEEYESRLAYLEEEQNKARQSGPEARTEVTEFSGLIGKTLDLAQTIFPNYEPIKKTELPSPENFSVPAEEDNTVELSPVDNLTNIYNEYLSENDPDHDDLLSLYDNCPNVANPDQLDSDADGIGDACDDNTIATSSPASVPGSAGEGSAPSEEPAGESPDQSSIANPDSVEIIELPAPAEQTETPTETAPIETPADTSETAPAETAPAADIAAPSPPKSESAPIE